MTKYSPRRPARILHTSDCHLDDVDSGSHRDAFISLIDLSINLAVDLVLISGDLFDHSRVGEETLDWTARQLDRSGRPIVLLTGNHDCLDEASVHQRFGATARCRDVYFIDSPDGTTVRVPGTDVTVWGRAMVEHAPSFRPLLGHPARTDGCWSIVAGHGQIVDGPAPGRSSLITRQEIKALDADYVALGHIHVYQVLENEPLTAYSGATASSRGGVPGCVLVSLHAGCAPSAEWTPLDTKLADDL